MNPAADRACGRLLTSEFLCNGSHRPHRCVESNHSDLSFLLAALPMHACRERVEQPRRAVGAGSSQLSDCSWRSDLLLARFGLIRTSQIRITHEPLPSKVLCVLD